MIYRNLQIALLFLFLLIPAERVLGQMTYEERRNEIIEKQQSTRSQIQNLEEQIATYSERLGYATERFDQTFQQFEELSRVISLQQERIRQMNREQQQIREEITLIEQNITELEERLNYLVNQYKETLTYLYKNGRTTEIALIFTSTSFNQLMVRSFYLAKFDEHRQKQMDEIEQARQELEVSKEDLEESRERISTVLASILEETEELEQRKELQSRNIELLRRDKNNLENQLATFQQQRSELDNILDELSDEEERIRIAEEERQRNLAEASLIEDPDERRAAEARYSRPIMRESMVSDDELLTYEENFREQRGQLPWPVDNGFITEKFGIRVHPVFNTRTNNPGVDIAAPPRSTVRVVNDGYVFGIQPLQGFGELIFVNHGTYKTAYGNLSDIFVRKNEVLKSGDVIGLSGDENSIRGEVLFFLIREGSQNVNPENWLREAVQ